MKQYLLRTTENLPLNSETEYINECCKYCDILLERIKTGISEKMKIEANEIVLGQEDWGWFLEFQNDGIFYEINISYQEQKEAEVHEFGMTAEAGKLEKGFFFDKKIEPVEKSEELSKIVGIIAKENNLEMSEE